MHMPPDVPMHMPKDIPADSAVHALLAGIVDYAGLFPPAALGMPDAAVTFARWRGSAERWILGRFVAPATRLVELEESGGHLFPRQPEGAPWRIAALLGTALDADMARVLDFNVRHASATHGAAVCDVVELRSSTGVEVERAASLVPCGTTAYVEVPLSSDPRPLVDAIGGVGLRAKARTGGVTPDAVPEPAALARFIARCAEARVPFKATAGLHHPVRAAHALTYERGSARAVMHGFLNVFLAAAVAWRAPRDVAAIQAVLEEGDPGAFHIGEDAVAWHGHRFGAAEIATVREHAAISFGSCSFDEPVHDLRAMGALP